MVTAMSDENVGDARPGARRSNKQIKFFAGGAVVVAVILYLVITSIQGATAEYLTVGKVIAQEADSIVRVNGTILGDTIEWDAHNLTLRFELSDDTGRLPVFYQGLRPDMFRDGATAVVEGKMGSDGVFQASQILLKCPSKYEEKATDEASGS